MNGKVAFYQAVVHVCAIAWLVFLFKLYWFPEVAWFDLAFWLVFGLATHAVQFDAMLARGNAWRVSVGFASSMACVVLFQPPVAAVLLSINSISLRDLGGKTEWYKIAFNRSMFAICGGIGSVVFQALDGVLGYEGTLRTLVAGAGASSAYYLANSIIVAGIVGLSADQSPWDVWRTARSTATQISYFTLGAMGTSLALVYRTVGPLGVLILGITLVASYFSLRNSALVSQFYTQIVQSLSDSLDLREHETAGHTRRIAVTARMVAERLGERGRSLDAIYMGGLLHDLGKLGMPDGVLLKPGRLTEDEWAVARRHPTEGALLLEPYEHLKEVAPIVRHHHERFDGSGYPEALKGESIPLGARIVSVVDAFDAMYFGRPYREPISMEEAFKELVRSQGTQFDPRVVETFVNMDWANDLAELFKEDGVDANR